MDISIIIPAYNSARYLARAIDSALEQTEVEIEIIVVDNNSDDDTLLVAKKFLQENPERVIVLAEKEQGAAAARNTGLRHSTGQFIQFLDSDDALLPGKLLRQVSLCTSYDWVIGTSRRVNERGEMFEMQPDDDAWKGIFTGRIGDTNANFFRRQALLDINGQDNNFKRGQDTDLYLRLLKANAPYVVDKQPGAVYMTREERRLWHESPAQLAERILERDIGVVEYLSNDRPEYFQRNYSFFKSTILMKIRQLATLDWQKAMVIYQKGFPEGVARDAIDLSILPSFAALYPYFGFLAVERLRLGVAGFFSVKLKDWIKKMLA